MMLTSAVPVRRGSALDDLEMLELGASREVLSTKCSSPVARKAKWQECFIFSEDKASFSMHDEESGEVLLTAKRVGTDYYISQYEDFPETFEGAAGAGCDSEQGRFCGVLRLDPSKKSYTLRSASCELCDEVLHKFSCGAYTSCTDRQILATVKHATKLIDGTDIEARFLSAQLPALISDTERIVWCARTMGSDILKANRLLRTSSAYTAAWSRRASHNDAIGAHVEESKARNDDDDDQAREASLQTGPKSAKSMRRAFSTPVPSGSPALSAMDNLQSDRFQLSTKLPVWSEDIGSLVLKFRNRRVLMASSKNFILTDACDKMIFQLGKAESGRFNVDFQHPMSALQAFGIALSAYGFTAKPKK